MIVTTEPGRGPFVLLTAFVCVASTALAALLGALASLLYGGPGIGASESSAPTMVISLPLVGMVVGAVTGLAAAIIWCRGLLRRVRRRRTTGLVGAGTWLGIKVGALSAALLHIALMIASRTVSLEAPLIGLACGIAGGLFLGVISGGLCLAAGKRAGVIVTPADREEAE